MGLFTDILKGLPENAVLRHKVAEKEERYAALETENAILKDDLRDAKAEITKLKKQVEELSHNEELADVELRLLQIIAARQSDDSFEGVLADESQLPYERFKFHIKNLENAGYVTGNIIDPHYGTLYHLTHEARRLLAKRGLL